MIHSSLSLLLFLLLFVITLQPPIVMALPELPNPDPSNFQQEQQFLPDPSPPATIPSFPEQSAVSGCSITQLPNDSQLLSAVKSACIGKKKTGKDGQLLHQSRCCPVLAAWLYSAYEEQYKTKMAMRSKKMWYDEEKEKEMPMLPDDTEMCGEGIEKVMKDRGLDVDRMKPNSTCDAVYCYCGIRLHPFNCPPKVDGSEIVNIDEDEGLKRLESDCSSSHSSSSSSFSSSSSSRSNTGSGLVGCSKCLHSLYKLSKGRGGNSTKSEDRTSKMRGRDCELMGLTWLLAQNRAAYMHTVTSVLRAIMMSKDGSDPRSCSLNSDGMPLAVDSSEVSGQSSLTTLQHFLPLYSFFLVYLLLWFVHLVF